MGPGIAARNGAVYFGLGHARPPGEVHPGADELACEPEKIGGSEFDHAALVHESEQFLGFLRFVFGCHGLTFPGEPVSRGLPIS